MTADAILRGLKHSTLQRSLFTDEALRGVWYITWKPVTQATKLWKKNSRGAPWWRDIHAFLKSWQKIAIFQRFFRNFSISFACRQMKLDVRVQTNIMQSLTASVNKYPLFPHTIIHSISEKFLKNRAPNRNFKIVQMLSILCLPRLNRPREIEWC